MMALWIALAVFGGIVIGLVIGAAILAWILYHLIG